MIRRWYGASPWHLAGVLASFAVTVYAADRLLEFDRNSVLLWFAGAIIGHDLILFPLYAVADAVVVRLPRRTVVPWINHIRFPVAISGLLLLVWWPSIVRRPDTYEFYSTLDTDAYLGRWLAISVGLVAASAAWYGIRVLRATRRRTR